MEHVGLPRGLGNERLPGRHEEEEAVGSLGAGVGGGRSRRPSAQSCETLAASNHVSGRFPFSKLQPAPARAYPRRAERVPPRGVNAPPCPPQTTRVGRAACEQRRRAWPSAEAALQGVGLGCGGGGRAPHLGPRGRTSAYQSDSRLRIPRPSPSPRPPPPGRKPQPRGRPGPKCSQLGPPDILSTSALDPDPTPRLRRPEPRRPASHRHGRRDRGPAFPRTPPSGRRGAVLLPRRSRKDTRPWRGGASGSGHPGTGPPRRHSDEPKSELRIGQPGEGRGRGMWAGL
ncbi:hypothetical protein NN561_010777 [Cricetulus griseus]